MTAALALPADAKAIAERVATARALMDAAGRTHDAILAGAIPVEATAEPMSDAERAYWAARVDVAGFTGPTFTATAYRAGVASA